MHIYEVQTSSTDYVELMQLYVAIQAFVC